jgi:CSLREA domain-containing protein
MAAGAARAILAVADVTQTGSGAMVGTNVRRLVEGRTMILVITALAAASLMFARPAHADTFTVNNTFDPGGGTCDPNDGCTLREAIEAANETPGADTINFDIPGSGVRSIVPDSKLPEISQAVTIDGYSQPGGFAQHACKGHERLDPDTGRRLQRGRDERARHRGLQRRCAGAGDQPLDRR